MLIAAAVCPHPPLLVPEAMGAAGWPETPVERDAVTDVPVQPILVEAPSAEAQVDEQIRQVRAACYAAVRDLAAAGPDLIVVVGGGEATRTYPGSAAGSLRGLGIPFTTGAGEPVLPLALAIGGWLVRHCLDQGKGRTPGGAAGSAPPGADPADSGQTGQVPGVCGTFQHAPPGPLDRPDGKSAGLVPAIGSSGQPVPPCRLELREVDRSWPASECMALGERLAAAAPKVALLVMGDGSARKVLGVPGAPDPPAERFDAQVADALAAGDVGVLAGLDPRLAEEYLVTGRPAWQVLAGAAVGGRIRGQLRYAAAPLDVSYLVASWRLD